MRKLSVLAIIAVSLLFAGCSALFEFNAFEGMSKPRVKSSDDFDSITEYIDYLDEVSDSDSFMEELEKDPDKKNETIDALQGVVDDPDATTKDKQEASLLIADIEVRTTGGDEFINNLTGLVSDPSALEGDSGPEGIVMSLLPDDMTTVDAEGNKTIDPESKDEFVALVNGLVAADDAYDIYGASLTDEDGDGELDDQTDEDLSTVAQTALVSHMIGSLSENLNNEENTGEILYSVVTGEEVDSQVAQEEEGSMENMENYDPITELGEEGTPINNILSVAGFDTLLGDMFGGSEEPSDGGV